MPLLEDVKRMQQQGMQEDQMVQLLKDQGYQYREIADALGQSRIRAAVEEPNADPQQAPDQEMMQQSLMEAPPAPGASNQYNQEEYYNAAPIPSQEYAAPSPGDQTPYAEPQEGYTQNYAQGTGADLIGEIAEQVVAEKLSEVRKHLEKVIDLKTTFESKIEFLDDRLKKIEKVIDTLQTSVLRKVGDYVTNVQDLKNELIETQKTFTAVAQKTPRKHPQHHHNAQHHNKPQHHSHEHHHTQHKK